MQETKMEKIKLNVNLLRLFGDELSQNIYRNRIDYSNGSSEAIEQIVNTVACGKEFMDFMVEHKDNLYIFGAGIRGQTLVRTWGWKFPFCAFIDNDKKKQGKVIENIPVISVEQIRESKENVAIIIMSKFNYAEIAKQLRANGFSDLQVLNIGNAWHLLNKNQYFDLEYLDVTDGENFVDCGAFDGDTSLNLYEKFGSCINKIWMFEPDKRNIEKAKNNFKDKEIDYQIIEKGVWSSAARLHFDALGNVEASINESGTAYIDTVKLDDVLDGCRPTFIKMDIEGAELEALRGAEQLIKKYRPKLAISVYHKREDINEIPELLLKYNPDYIFYLRHYSLTSSETVLYAI